MPLKKLEKTNPNILFLFNFQRNLSLKLNIYWQYKAARDWGNVKEVNFCIFVTSKRKYKTLDPTTHRKYLLQLSYPPSLAPQSNHSKSHRVLEMEILFHHRGLLFFAAPFAFKLQLLEYSIWKCVGSWVQTYQVIKSKQTQVTTSLCWVNGKETRQRK